MGSWGPRARYYALPCETGAQKPTLVVIVLLYHRGDEPRGWSETIHKGGLRAVVVDGVGRGRVWVSVDGRVGFSKWVVLGGVTEAAGVRDEGGVVHLLRVRIGGRWWW